MLGPFILVLKTSATFDLNGLIVPPNLTDNVINIIYMPPRVVDHHNTGIFH